MCKIYALSLERFRKEISVIPVKWLDEYWENFEKDQNSAWEMAEGNQWYILKNRMTRNIVSMMNS